MKKLLLTFSMLLFGVASLLAQVGNDYDTLVHKAVYDGKDLMVKNQFDSRNGFSVKEVLLNDKVLRDPTNNGTFTVKLGSAGLSSGDEYTLKIIYYESAQPPKILSDN